MIALSLVFLSPGCQAPAHVDHRLDLLPLVWTADFTRRVVLFGTPAAEPYLAHGFVRAEVTRDEHPFVWARRRLHLRLPEGLPQGPLLAVLDLAPADGIQDQSVAAFVDESPVGRLRLRPGRQRYRLDIPQGSGARKLRLAFARGTAPVAPHKRRLAAKLFALTFGTSDDPAMQTYVRPGGFPPLSVVHGTRQARLTWAGSGGLHFALSLAQRGTFSGRPFLAPDSPPATFSITLEQDGAPGRTLWSQRLQPGAEEPTARVALAGLVGKPMRLGLHLQAEAGHVPVGGWIAPAVTGGDTRPDLFSLRPTPADDTSAEGSRQKPPGGLNVVLVVLDAARARSFSGYGYARRTTPEIDRLASEGVLFERAYAAAPFTLSAMPSIWTSLYPDEHHAGVPYDSALPRERLTVAEILAAHGIATAGFIANSFAGPAYGLDRGFAEFHELHSELDSNDADVFDRVLPGWLAAHAGERFFAYLHFREPHFPYNPPQDFRELFGPDTPLPASARRDPTWYNSVNDHGTNPSPQELAHLVRLYDGNLAYADHHIGVLRRRLEEAGLLDKTVIIVTADHGESLYEHGYIGHVRQLYEESIRIPLVIRFPAGRGPIGRRITALTDHLDLGPTLLELFGLHGRGGSDRVFRGRSLLPIIAGAPGKEATLSVGSGEMRDFALRHERFKYVRTVAFDVERLHDLDADPEERENIAASLPVRAAYYRQVLHRRLLQTRRPLVATAPVHMTPEQRRNLKALGYLQ